MVKQRNDSVGDEQLKGCLLRYASACGDCLSLHRAKTRTWIWSIRSSSGGHCPFHSSVHHWSNIQGSLGLPKRRNDGSETCLSFPLPRHHYDLLSLLPPSLSSLAHAAVARHWRTAQSPCPSDTRMGSSQTATAATESKWQSRNTWRPSSGKGIDRELETKDAGSHICSTVLSQTWKKKPTKKQTTKLKCVPPQMKSSWDLSNQWIFFLFSF